MSIVNTVDVTFQPFQFPPQNGRPRGLFGATKATTGDVTGGDITTGIVHSNNAGFDLIYQLDSCIISNDADGADKFQIIINEGGVYSADTIVRGDFLKTDHQELRSMAGMILQPTKAGGVTLFTFVTANDDGDLVSISIRGRYWERSYLRQMGQTPLFL